jgi:hypothetical protein
VVNPSAATIMSDELACVAAPEQVGRERRDTDHGHLQADLLQALLRAIAAVSAPGSVGYTMAADFTLGRNRFV